MSQKLFGYWKTMANICDTRGKGKKKEKKKKMTHRTEDQKCTKAHFDFMLILNL